MRAGASCRCQVVGDNTRADGGFKNRLSSGVFREAGRAQDPQGKANTNAGERPTPPLDHSKSQAEPSDAAVCPRWCSVGRERRFTM